MAILDCVSEVGVFVKDLKKARPFYTRTLGLKVRSAMPKFGYLSLGATLKGEDASLDLWAPEASWGTEMYESGLKKIGEVTGIGFRTGNLDKTVDSLKRRKVKAEVSREMEGEPFGRFEDPDGNVHFLFQPTRPKDRRAGLLALDFVTVVTRDLGRSGEFFTKALGLKGKKSETFAEYRLGPKGTAISPFSPKRENYTDPADYDTDMAHIGEVTTIAFETDDVYSAQDKLMARGVRFKQKAQKEPWGGIQAKLLDPDDNEYSIIEME